MLRTRLDSDAGEAELREEVDTQLRRMNDLVTYQLSRAARSGHQLFAAPIEIEPLAEQIVTGLEKVYAAKRVLCEFEIAPQVRFHGETGDLQELLGNLLENAFKWAAARVLLTVPKGWKRRAVDRGYRSSSRTMVRALPMTASRMCCSAACAATSGCRGTGSAWPSCRTSCAAIAVNCRSVVRRNWAVRVSR